MWTNQNTTQPNKVLRALKYLKIGTDPFGGCIMLHPALCCGITTAFHPETKYDESSWKIQMPGLGDEPCLWQLSQKLRMPLKVDEFQGEDGIGIRFRGGGLCKGPVGGKQAEKWFIKINKVKGRGGGTS